MLGVVKKYLYPENLPEPTFHINGVLITGISDGEDRTYEIKRETKRGVHVTWQLYTLEGKTWVCIDRCSGSWRRIITFLDVLSLRDIEYLAY